MQLLILEMSKSVAVPAAHTTTQGGQGSPKEESGSFDSWIALFGHCLAPILS